MALRRQPSGGGFAHFIICYLVIISYFLAYLPLAVLSIGPAFAQSAVYRSIDINNIGSHNFPSRNFTSKFLGTAPLNQARLMDDLLQDASRRGAGLISGWLSKYGQSKIALAITRPFKLAKLDIELLYPFFDSANWLFFSQNSYSYSYIPAKGVQLAQHKHLLNSGLGLRYFAPNFGMVGVNNFFDYDIIYRHQRLGIGAEYWRDYVKLALNSYIGLSPWQESERPEFFAKAAHGFDVRLLAYLPFYPQIGLNSGYRQYFGKNVAIFNDGAFYKDPAAYWFGLEYQPIPLVQFKLNHEVDLQGRYVTRAGLNLNYKIGFPLNEQLDSANMATLRNLSGLRYDFVARQRDIILDYKKESLLTKAQEFKGKPQQVFKIFQVSDIAKSRKISWHGLDEFIKNKGSLSKACFDIHNLASCAVTLPLHKDSSIDEAYELTLTLRGKENWPTRDVSFKFIVAKEEVVTYRQIGGDEGASFALFDHKEPFSESLSDFQFIEPVNFSEFTKLGGQLSKECFAAKSLKQCKLTLPYYNTDLSAGNRYVFIWKLRNQLYEEQAVGPRGKTAKSRKEGERKIGELVIKRLAIVKRPIAEAVELSPTLSGFSSQEIVPFSKVSLNPGWEVLDWELPNSFTEQEGQLSPACYDAFALAAPNGCIITLPELYNQEAAEFPLKLKLRNPQLQRLFAQISEQGLAKEKLAQFNQGAREVKFTIKVKNPAEEKIVVNNVIKGYQAQQFPLFSEVYLKSDKWRATSIDFHQRFSALGGSFSPECSKIKQLGACRVTLPAFDQQAPQARDQYAISFKIYPAPKAAPKGGESEGDHQPKEAKEFTITIQIYPQLVIAENSVIRGEQLSQHRAFKEIRDLDENWENKGWQLDKDFVLLGGSVSEECRSLLDLAKCQITLPYYSAEAASKDPAFEESNSYELKLKLFNKLSSQSKEIKIRTIINKPQKEVVSPHSPLIGISGQSYNVFQKVQLSSDIWDIVEWGGFDKEKFKEKGGQFSRECYNTGYLSSCLVALPKVERDGSEPNYQLSFVIRNKREGFTKTYPIKVKVIAPTLGSESRLDVRERIPFLHDEVVTLSLKDEKGALLNLEENELGKVLELKLEPLSAAINAAELSPILAGDSLNDKDSTDNKADSHNTSDDSKSDKGAADKKENKESEYKETQLGPLYKIGHGQYQAQLHAGNRRAFYNLAVYYYNNLALAQKIFIYSDKLDPRRSYFSVLPNPLPIGGTAQFSFTAYNKDGDLLDDRLRKIGVIIENYQEGVEDNKSQPLEQKLELELMLKQPGSYYQEKAFFKGGKIKVTPCYNDHINEITQCQPLPDKAQIVNISGQLFSGKFSQLVIAKDRLASYKGGGLFDSTEIKFIGYDKAGKSLKGYEGYLRLAVYDEAGALLEYLPLRAVADNIYHAQFNVKNEAADKDSAPVIKPPGIYKLRAEFLQREISDLSAQILITPDLAPPQKITCQISHFEGLVKAEGGEPFELTIRSWDEGKHKQNIAPNKWDFRFIPLKAVDKKKGENGPNGPDGPDELDEADSASIAQIVPKAGQAGVYQIFGLKDGIYKLKLAYKGPVNPPIICDCVDKLIFVEAKPYPPSYGKIETFPHEPAPIGPNFAPIAVNDSASYVLSRKVDFYAFDIEGAKLDLRKYGAKQAHAQNLSLRLRKDGSLLAKSFALKFIADNHYSAVIDNSFISEGRGEGNYELIPYYKDKPLVARISDQLPDKENKALTIILSPNHAVPQKIAIEPQQKRINISLPSERSVIIDFAYQSKEGFAQNDIANRLDYKITYKPRPHPDADSADQTANKPSNDKQKLEIRELTSQEVREIFQLKEHSANHYKMLFKPLRPGDYTIIPRYHLFAKKSGSLSTEDGAWQDLDAQARIEVRDGSLNELIAKGSSLRADKAIIASYDKEQQKDRLTLSLVVINGDKEPSLNLTNLEFYIRDSAKNTILRQSAIDKGNGCYEAQIASRGDDSADLPVLPIGDYEAVAAFNGKVIANLKSEFSVDANLSPTSRHKSEFTLSSDSAFIEKIGGSPIRAVLALKDRYGQAQDLVRKKISVQIYNAEGKLAANSARISAPHLVKEELDQPSAKRNWRYSYDINALTEGEYSLVFASASALDLDSDSEEEGNVLKKWPLFFKSDKPATSSTLVLEDPVIAVNDSANHRVKTIVRFTARAENGQKYDKSFYRPGVNLDDIYKIAVSFGQNGGDLKEYKLAYDDKTGSFASEIGNELLRDEATNSFRPPGRYKLTLLYHDEFYRDAKGQEITSFLDFSPDLALPQNLKDDTLAEPLSFGSVTKVGFNFQTIEGYPQYGLFPRLKYELYRDNKPYNSANIKLEPIAKAAEQSNRYELNIIISDKASANDAGDYEIRPFYQSFSPSGGDGEYLPIKSKISFKIVPSLLDLYFASDKSELMLEKNTIASYDAADRLDNTKVILKARNTENAPSVNLAKFGLYFSIRDQNNVEIGQLSPQQSSTDGLGAANINGEYSAIFSAYKDYGKGGAKLLDRAKYYAPGIYKIMPAFKTGTSYDAARQAGQWSANLIKNVTIDANLSASDHNTSQIELSRNLIIPQDLGGKPLTIKVSLKDALGNPQERAEQEAVLELFDKEGKQQDEAGTIGMDPAIPGSYSLIAKKQGDYLIKVQRLDYEGINRYDIVEKGVTISDGMPSAQSTLVLDKPTIGAKRSGPFGKTLLSFIPKTAAGEIIDYNKLLRDGVRPEFTLQASINGQPIATGVRLEKGPGAVTPELTAQAYRVTIKAEDIFNENNKSCSKGPYQLRMVYQLKEQAETLSEPRELSQPNAELLIAPEYDLPDEDELSLMVAPPNRKLSLVNGPTQAEIKMILRSPPIGKAQCSLPLENAQGRLNAWVSRNGTETERKESAAMVSSSHEGNIYSFIFDITKEKEVFSKKDIKYKNGQAILPYYELRFYYKYEKKDARNGVVAIEEQLPGVVTFEVEPS